MSAPEELRKDPHTGTELRAHSWDGIEELDTPLPRWWLYIFYASIAVSVVYWVLMPAWPLVNGYTKGVLGFSDRANVVRDIAALEAQRGPQFERLLAATPEQVAADPQLAEFAFAAGESAFGDNCATCHGAGGAGRPGYPSLADDVWIWGGSLDDIEHTLRVGIRSGHEEARISQMPAFGRDGIYDEAQIADVAEFVITLGPAAQRLDPDPAAAARGAALYGEQCAVCHGAGGEGQRAIGAPSLADDIWLYGGSREDIRTQIALGRGGVMPSWDRRFDPATIRALALYVHGLGGGESAPAPAPALTPVEGASPAEAPAVLQPAAARP